MRLQDLLHAAFATMFIVVDQTSVAHDLQVRMLAHFAQWDLMLFIQLLSITLGLLNEFQVWLMFLGCADCTIQPIFKESELLQKFLPPRLR